MDALETLYNSREYKRMAREAHSRATKELDDTPVHLLDKGNPNHPDNDLQLFGQNYREFMARQYK